MFLILEVQKKSTLEIIKRLIDGMVTNNLMKKNQKQKYSLQLVNSKDIHPVRSGKKSWI